MNSYKVIKDFGISLFPAGDDSLIMLMQDENIKQFLENHPKSENFNDKFTFDDVIERVKGQLKNAPKQTSQELKALQDILNGQEIDPVAQEMLTGFMPEVNKMCVTIIKKLFALEATIKTIEEESKGYGFYIMQIRDDLYDDLEKLRERFEPDNSSADKDEL